MRLETLGRRRASVEDAGGAPVTPSARKDDDEEWGATAEKREVVEAILSSWNGDGRLLELRPRAELQVELVIDDSLRQKIEQRARRVSEDKGNKGNTKEGLRLATFTGIREIRRRSGRTPARKYVSLGARFEGEGEGKWRGGLGILQGQIGAGFNGRHGEKSAREDCARNGRGLVRGWG